MIRRNPLLLQMSVDDVLKPRLAYLQQIGFPSSSDSSNNSSSSKFCGFMRRYSVLLCIDSSAVQERVAFLSSNACGRFTPQDIATIVVTTPMVLVLNPSKRIMPVIEYMKHELGFEHDDETLKKVLTRGGALSRSLETTQRRIRVLQEFGVDKDSLRVMLRRFPRLLLYPLEEEKYQRKFRYLRGVLGAGPAELVRFPQYLTYNLAERVAPRVAGIRAYKPGAIPPLSPLARKFDAFLEYYGVDVEAYTVAVEKWKESEEYKEYCRT